MDEPIVWYELTGGAMRRFLHKDERGSVIAAADKSGNAIALTAAEALRGGTAHSTDWPATSSGYCTTPQAAPKSLSAVVAGTTLFFPPIDAEGHCARHNA